MRRGSQVAVALVCVILGMMVSLQFKVQQAMSSNPAFQRSEELARRLRDAEKERADLQQEVADLRGKLAEMAEGKNVIATLTDQLQAAQMMAGLTALEGPGVTVVMDDSKRPSLPGDDPNAFIIHDDDILSVVNELRAAGAEALSINGQRVISKTEIRCVGPTISVNGVRIAPPITITAIGDPQTLEAGLKTRGGIVDNLGLWGIEVTVKRGERLEVPAFGGSTIFRYAQAQKKGG
ncbi:MAG: DUF881 domain-containing protein [Firmicutes bacterium]|jgi:uncharacterized protein YlxW (UPF0749 family)|nr:DUF881 domain-containing protein [Bacillota bacterium]